MPQSVFVVSGCQKFLEGASIRNLLDLTRLSAFVVSVDGLVREAGER